MLKSCAIFYPTWLLLFRLLTVNPSIKRLMATLGAYCLLATQEDGKGEEGPSQRRKKLG